MTGMRGLGLVLLALHAAEQLEADNQRLQHRLRGVGVDNITRLSAP